jgi:serine/threonine-protein kinase
MTLRGGRYEIIRVIASGGMAQVCLGRALGAGGFERLVAVKAMHAHLAAEQDFVDMFLDEARLAARIRHPNVVATLDVQQDDEGLFLVMEYVEGPALQAVLRHHRRAKRLMPIELTLRVFLDAMAGLHAAHELTGAEGEPLNLVHRDISPHNILIGVDGVTRLTDFGVAQAESRLSTTRGGEVKGKFPYMAQEQIQRAGIDRRTDVYAAGAVLWEMLAGERLVRGDNDGQLLTQILRAEVRSIRALNPGVPEEIEAVCQRALQRAPDDRHPTAAAFAEALESAARAAGIAVATPREIATFVKDLKVHESSTDSPSGSLRKPTQSSARAAITAPTTGSSSVSSASATGSLRVEPEPTSTRGAAVAPVAITPPAKRTGPALIAVAAGVVLAIGAVVRLLLPHAGSPSIAVPAAAISALAPAAPRAPDDAPILTASAATPAASALAVAPAASSASAAARIAPASGGAKATTTAAPRPTVARPTSNPTPFRPTEL